MRKNHPRGFNYKNSYGKRRRKDKDLQRYQLEDSFIDGENS